MNLKKKMKAFFTMNRHANDGFTLVELIVVIAILAILAGVAVPAYSGYIEKANLAADETVLSAVNTAFAAACIIEGVDNYNASGSTANVDANGKVTNVTAPGVDATVFNSTFASLFDSESAFTREGVKLFYKQSIGGFAFNETVTFKFGNTNITLSSEDIEILSGDNAFSNRGSAELLKDVAVLENLLKTGIGEDVLTDVKQSDAFLWALGGYAGMEQGADESDDDYLDKVAGYMMDPTNADAVYSAQIMFAASHAANATEDAIKNLFQNPDGKAVTSCIEGDSDEETMANAALAYGMYTAYKQRHSDAEGVDNFTNTVNSPEFATYFASEQGQSDLDAYMAAMNMISNNTSNPEVTSDILKNGIAGNEELAELMKEVMGK